MRDNIRPVGLVVFYPRTRKHINYVYYKLTVHPSITEQVPEGTKFLAELTEEGILFRVQPNVPIPKKPKWAKKKEGR